MGQDTSPSLSGGLHGGGGGEESREELVPSTGSGLCCCSCTILGCEGEEGQEERVLKRTETTLT